MSSRILFIGHEASRTGAPMVLLHLLRWMRQHQPATYAGLLLLNEGGMTANFREAAAETLSVRAAWAAYRRSPGYVVRRLASLAGNKKSPEAGFRKHLDHKIRQMRPEILYANTVISFPEAIAARKALGGSIKIVVHVHEMASMIATAFPGIRPVIHEADLFIAASEPVRDALIHAYGVDPAKVHVVYECAEIGTQASAPRTAEISGVFTVGGAGAVQYRKGFDFFIETARQIQKKMPDAAIRFRWAGAVDVALKALVDGDLERSGLRDMVVFDGETTDPDAAFRAFDLFLCPSREDPFPLVCIEAALHGLPVVCFDKGNGVAPFVARGAGMTVPYGDPVALADAVLHYFQNHESRIRDGLRARDIFSQFTPERQCGQIADLLSR